MIRAAALCLVLVSAPAVAGDTVVRFRGDDPEMSEAIAKAQESLPMFIDALEKGAGEEFQIKARFDTTDGHGEHIWVDRLIYVGGRFFGALLNEPNDVPGLHRGDRVPIEKSTISDWFIFADGKKFGGFTQRVMERRGERPR